MRLSERYLRRKKTVSVIKIAKWLLAHRDEAIRIYEIAKNWSSDMDLVEKWAILDAVARVIIPILTAEGVLWSQDFEYEDDVEVMAVGGEVAALGIPWVAVSTILFPILQMVFDFVLREDE